MEEHQKKVVFVIGLILVVIVLLVLVLNHYAKNEEPNKPEVPIQNTFNKEISALNDYDEFFTVNHIVNQYYLTLAGSDTELVYSFLDDEYIAKNNITINNLNSKINRDYHNVSFTATEIYYNHNSVITYYFVNGFLEDENLEDDSFKYYKDIKYLVIVDKSSAKFTITPINSNVSILNVATNYVLKEKKLKNNVYHIYTTTEERVLQTYLSTFKNMLFLDNAKAYAMLADEKKKKYLNYEDFKSQAEAIYNAIGTRIFSYAKNEETTGNVYRIVDNKERRFTIYESKTMSFKIDY